MLFLGPCQPSKTDKLPQSSFHVNRHFPRGLGVSLHLLSISSIFSLKNFRPSKCMLLHSRKMCLPPAKCLSFYYLQPWFRDLGPHFQIHVCNKSLSFKSLSLKSQNLTGKKWMTIFLHLKYIDVFSRNYCPNMLPSWFLFQKWTPQVFLNLPPHLWPWSKTSDGSYQICI